MKLTSPDNLPNKTEHVSESKKDALGFWLQGISAFILVKTVGFLGAIASFISYFWLVPKIGMLGALICSVILGVVVGIGVMVLFLNEVI
jgi:hypothetical protein